MARGSYAFGLEAGDHGKRELSVTFFPVSGGPIDLEKVVGTGACLTVRHTDGDAERAFRGIVSAARFLGRKKGRWQYRCTSRRGSSCSGWRPGAGPSSTSRCRRS
jgi:hypothetical protein